jgi:hypothetical protein
VANSKLEKKKYGKANEEMDRGSTDVRIGATGRDVMLAATHAVSL